MLGLLSDPGLCLKLAARAARSRLTGVPYLLNIHLTRRCDSRCRHCRIWKHEDFSRELGLEDYRRMFAGLGGGIGILNLTGGQPAMKKDLDRIMLGALELLPGLVLMQCATNALTPAADLELIDTVLERRPRFSLRYSISLDGLGADHDAVRGAAGNFEKARELFDKLAGRRKRFAGLRIGFSTTIGGFNLDRLEDIAGAFPGKDYHTFDFYHASRAYYGEAPAGGMALDAGGKEAAAAVLSRVRPAGLEGVLNGMFRALAADPRRQPACAAGSASISVFPDGEIKRCYFLEEAVGDLRSSGHDVPALLRAARPRLREACRKCWNTCNAYATMTARPLSTAAALLMEGADDAG